MEAPDTSRISLILEPPLPISEPHCDAGTIRRRVTGGRGTLEDPSLGPSSSNFLQIMVNAFKMDSVDPVTVTILSGTDPSVMWILAPDSSLILLMISPPLPIIEPTSFPFIIIRMVRVTLGMSGLSMSDILGRSIYKLNFFFGSWLVVVESGCLGYDNYGFSIGLILFSSLEREENECLGNFGSRE